MQGAAGKINGYVISLRHSQIGSSGLRRSRAEKRSIRNEKRERARKESQNPTDGFAQTRRPRTPMPYFPRWRHRGVSLLVHAARHVTLSSCPPLGPMSAPLACIHLLFLRACQPCNGSMAASVLQVCKRTRGGPCRRLHPRVACCGRSPREMNKGSGSRCRLQRQISKHEQPRRGMVLRSDCVIIARLIHPRLLDGQARDKVLCCIVANASAAVFRGLVHTTPCYWNDTPTRPLIWCPDTFSSQLAAFRCFQ